MKTPNLIMPINSAQKSCLGENNGSQTLKITFKYSNKGLADSNFDFDKKITVKEMLNIFLEKTNSVKTFDTKKIMFTYSGKILTLPKFIGQNIENIFQRGKIIIEVRDKGNYIGG